MDQFVTFQRFNDRAAVDEFTALLTEHNIPFQLDEDPQTFDAVIGTELSLQVRVKLQQKDFEKVNDLLLNKSMVDLHSVDKEYHLFQFSDEELLEIVSRPDEWSSYDYVLSLQILKQRGKEITPELASVLRKNRIQELKKPESATDIWIIAGYAFAIIGGFVGIIMGIHISTHKKVLPNGDKVYAFAEQDRKHGFWISVIGCGVILGSVIYQVVIFTN